MTITSREFAHRVKKDSAGGFADFTDFVSAVQKASMGGRDTRIAIRSEAATHYGQEASGAEGGFAVPPAFAADIMSDLTAEDSIFGLTDRQTSTSNIYLVPADNTPPWDTASGIQVSWTSEADQIAPSKPQVQGLSLPLDKLTALIPVTDELLEDASALAAYVRKKAVEKMDFKLSLVILQGTGVGTPLGIVNAPGTIVVAKESGQSADTLLWANVRKMWSRGYGRRRAVWLMNQDIEDKLYEMSLEGATSSVPAFQPANNESGLPTLMGRPILSTQACETLGNKGDIILADLSRYLTVVRTVVVKEAVSMHLWFDYQITAFKFSLRVAGQPWLFAPLTPRTGSNTLSPYVVLEARA